ncbi:hypothetical protein [Halosimplex halobium]|uniref:hypothetical protein n=1 Tax=Halosimplex halobium TaxID=3396618 RepID=UPI003F546654
MRRDWWVTLAAAALVVLSGCAALGGGTATPGADAPTDSPVATPTATQGESTTNDAGTATGGAGAAGTDRAGVDSAESTATGTQSTHTPGTRATPGEGQSLPPGVRADGTVNETALLVAHFEAVAASGWRLHHRNGDDSQVVYSVDGEQYERDDRGAAWYSGGVLVTNRTLVGPPYEMESASNTTTGAIGPTSGISLALSVRMATSDYAWTGTTASDGRTLHELRMTGPKGAGASLGHYTGRLLVDDVGRIHRLTGEVGDNESVADTYDFDYEWGVDRAPRPPWLDRVPRGVVEKTPDGTALNVTLTGGAAVPAGTEFEFTHNLTTRTVTLDERLEPGESLYVGLRERDGDRSAVTARQPFDGEGLVDLRGQRTGLSGTATVDGVGVDLSFTVGRLDI